MKSKNKVVRLSKIPGIPDRPDIVRGVARKEWNRVVPLLFSMGRLSKLHMAALALYCVSYRRVVDLSKKIFQCTDEREQKLLKSVVRRERKYCKEAALGFGFPLDSTGRMDIERPLSLTGIKNPEATKPIKL